MRGIPAVMAVLAWLALGGVGPVAAQPAAVPGPAKIALGYVLAGDFITCFVAKDMGFFDRHGLDVTMVKMPLATSVPPALLSDSLQIGMSTGTIMVQAAAAGLDLVAVAGVSRFFADAPKVALVGRAGTAFRSAADLRGHTIGVPGLGSSMDVGVKMWLLEHHVPISTVNFVEASFPQHRDVLVNHSVDAVATLEPFLSRIIDTGAGYRIANYYAEVAPNALAAFWISTGDWARLHRDEIGRFRAALGDALAVIRARPEDTKEIEKKYLGYVSPAKPSISLDVAPADFDFFNRALVELHRIDRPVDTEKLVFR